MDQSINVLLAIDKVHIVAQRAPDCGPGLGWLNQVYESNHPSLPLLRVYMASITISTRCTNRNQFDILLTAVADVRKGQIYMPYKDELQTLAK